LKCRMQNAEWRAATWGRPYEVGKRCGGGKPPPYGVGRGMARACETARRVVAQASLS